MLTVTEEEIIEALRLVMERTKLIVETSAVVGVAAALFGKLPFEGERIGILLTGGNIALDRLPFAK
jgi:threonine dehydratase